MQPQPARQYVGHGGTYRGSSGLTGNLNPLGKLKFIIKSARFATNYDRIGNQDPSIKLNYKGRTYTTPTRWEAGREAVFNYGFMLEGVDVEGRNGGTM